MRFYSLTSERRVMREAVKISNNGIVLFVAEPLTESAAAA